MKFGEDLERVKGTSDPEWVPYWPNYGILKRLIKGLPQKQKTACFRANVVADSKSSTNNEGHDGTVQESQSRVESKQESHVNDVTAKNSSSKATHQYQILKRERGEVIFFKLLHAEVHKATHFFQETQESYAARARFLSTEMAAIDRMQEEDQQQLLLQKIFWLHQQLLRLEVFAIMSYCAFSKILKKHDKVTGFNTKAAFMEKIVNLTCITHTPRVQAMIEQCQEWMVHPKLVQERVVSSSDSPEEEQKPSKDHQKLFLETIKQLNNDEKKKESKTTTCSNNKSSSSDAHRDSLVSILSTVCKNASNSATNWFQAVSSSSTSQQPEPQKTILRQVSESACSVASTSSDEEGELEARECASSSGKRQMDEYNTAGGQCPFPKKPKLGATRAQ